jgi:hypothetical protein
MGERVPLSPSFKQPLPFPKKSSILFITKHNPEKPFDSIMAIGHRQDKILFCPVNPVIPSKG